MSTVQRTDANNINQELFRNLLKLKRKSMGAGNRAKSKSPKITKKWLYPHGIERRYAKGISLFQAANFTRPLTKKISENLPRWINEFRSDLREDSREEREDAFSSELSEILAILNKNFQDLYGPNAPAVKALISTTAIDTSTWNKAQSQKFFKDLLGVEFLVEEPWEQEVLETWAANNQELIKSLSSEYIKSVNDIVTDGVQFGKTTEEIMREIRAKNKQITGYRARLIARDQVGKLNGLLTKRRMEDAGIDMYTWSTAGDERVRGNPSGPFKNAVPSHYIMANKLCRWDDNTVYSEDGGNTWKKRTGKMPKAIPGQEIQCRCTSIPFFDDMIEEIDKEIEQEAA